jgi:hypothetical protein
MSFDSTGTGAIVPVKRIQPIFANMVGDQTAGGNAHIQDFLDARRFLRAKVANLTARNALSSPQDGDLVLVLDNGEGYTQIDRYKSSTSSWLTIASDAGVGEGGGSGGGGGSGAFKSPVRAATTVALPANTREANVLTADENGTLPAIDGVTLVADNRILVKNEATGANNGIYVATSLGSGSTKWVLTRSDDANTDALVMPNLLVFVSEGTYNGDAAFMLTTNASIVLNTTALTFVRAMGGAGGVMGSPLVMTETGSGSNLYNLPYTREYPMVWVDGSLQVKDVDFTVNAAGQVAFTPALDSGATVIASCAVYPTINGLGGGAMSAPALVAANAGSGNAVYALPGAGAEMVWKGGAIQVPGTDYTRNADTITFVENNIPAAGEEVVISVAQAPMIGTDALTLVGQVPAITATVNTLAQRGSDGTIKASNHESLGASGAAGSVIVADADGKVPAAALPVSSGPVRLDAIGNLATIVAADTIADVFFLPAAFTISAIDVICPFATASGNVEIDLLSATTSGGSFASLYTSNTKPSLTLAGGVSFATFTGANLPDTTALNAGTVLACKILDAEVGAQDLIVIVR